MKMNKSENAMREALGEFLGILQYKVKHGVMNADDVRAILQAIEAGGGVSATVSDLAAFYHTSEVNVRSVIKRRVFRKPVRRVYYDFWEFSRVVPATWHDRACHPSD